MQVFLDKITRDDLETITHEWVLAGVMPSRWHSMSKTQQVRWVLMEITHIAVLTART